MRSEPCKEIPHDPGIGQAINWDTPATSEILVPIALTSSLIVVESSEGSSPGVPVLVGTVVARLSFPAASSGIELHHQAVHGVLVIGVTHQL